jgi:hypothetical protein
LAPAQKKTHEKPRNSHSPSFDPTMRQDAWLPTRSGSFCTKSTQLKALRRCRLPLAFFEGEQRRSAALLALEPHHQDTKKPLL